MRNRVKIATATATLLALTAMPTVAMAQTKTDDSTSNTSTSTAIANFSSDLQSKFQPIQVQQNFKTTDSFVFAFNSSKLSDAILSLTKKQLNAYLVSANNTVKLPKSDVSVSGNTVTVNHSALSPYTEYAVVLTYGDIPTRLFNFNDLVSHKIPGFIKNIQLVKTGSAVGDAVNVSVKNDGSGSNLPVSVQSGDTLTVSATDSYGDPTTNAHVMVSGKNVVSQTVPIQNGQAKINVKASSEGQASIKLSIQNTDGTQLPSSVSSNLNQTVTQQFDATITPTTIVKAKAIPNSNGTVKLTATVTDSSGNPQPSVIVPFSAKNATLSSPYGVTDSTGTASVTVTPTSTSTGSTVSVQGDSASSNQTIGIDPIVYGNQTWTNTSIQVQAGELVNIQTTALTGDWQDSLYAEINGVPVKVGANGSFIAGSSGILSLGTDGTTQTGNVDSMVYLSTPSNVVPTMDFSPTTANIPANGTTIDPLTGQIMEGQYPVVGQTVTIAQTGGSGSLASTTVTTNGNGDFSDDYTAELTSGDATFSASAMGLTQTTWIGLDAVSTPAPTTSTSTSTSSTSSTPDTATPVITSATESWQNGLPTFTILGNHFGEKMPSLSPSLGWGGQISNYLWLYDGKYTWGYAGDYGGINYLSWSDNKIVVQMSPFTVPWWPSAGQTMQIGVVNTNLPTSTPAVVAPSIELSSAPSATEAQITGVTSSLVNGVPTFTVNGSNFGSEPNFWNAPDGGQDTPYLSLNFSFSGGSAGALGNIFSGVTDLGGLTIQSWTPTQIQFSLPDSQWYPSTGESMTLYLANTDTSLSSLWGADVAGQSSTIRTPFTFNFGQ